MENSMAQPVEETGHCTQHMSNNENSTNAENNGTYGTYGTLEAEVDFSKQATNLFFSFENMKKIKDVIDRNNFSKIQKLTNGMNDKIANNCVIYALHNDKPKFAKKMIKHFAKKGMKIDHNQILKYALHYDKKMLVILLLELGANVHVDDDYAFVKYCISNDLEMVKYLITKGADIYCRSCLSLIQAAGNGHIKIFNLLVERMEKRVVRSLSEYDVTNFDLALISAVTFAQNNVCKILLEHGANPTVNNCEVLLTAASNGNAELVQLLLDYGADPNILDGMVLKKTIQKGHFDVIKILVEYTKNGKYITDLSIDDSAALRWACYKGYYNITELLLNSKFDDGTPRCDPSAEDNDALRLAKKYGHQNIVELLERKE